MGWPSSRTVETRSPTPRAQRPSRRRAPRAESSCSSRPACAFSSSRGTVGRRCGRVSTRSSRMRSRPVPKQIVMSPAMRDVRHEAREGVGQRQVDERAIAAPHDPRHVARDARHGGVVALQQAAAARLAGRARRVDERHQVVGPHRRARVVDGRRVRGGVRHAHGGDAVQPHLVAQRQRLRHHGDELERRQPLADRRDAVGLRAVAGDDDAHLAVAQHVRQVVERGRRVRRHRHHAGRERRDVQQRPLEAGLRDDAQAIARPEAESQEPMCQLAHANFDLCPGPVPPRPALACAVCDARVHRERMHVQSRDGLGRKRHGVRLGRSERVQALSAIGSSASCRTASNRVLSIFPW